MMVKQLILQLEKKLSDLSLHIKKVQYFLKLGKSIFKILQSWDGKGFPKYVGKTQKLL